jgi:hypothetical protein
MIGFPKYRPIVVGAVGGSGTRVVADLDTLSESLVC